MDLIVDYYKLCTIAAGGRAHSAVSAAPEVKKALNLAHFLDADDTVIEHVIGGGGAPEQTKKHIGRGAYIYM